METQRYSLKTKLFAAGARLNIHQVKVNDRDEFRDFIDQLKADMSDSGSNFTAHLVEVFKIMREQGVMTPKHLFTKLEHCQDLWEIRRKRGRTNHRLYGFMVADRDFYIVRHADKRGEQPDKGDLSYVDRVRKAFLQMTPRERKDCQV